MKPLLQEPSDVLCLRPSCHATMANRATEEREYRLLTESRKTYPKYPLTRSNPIQQRDSIIHANIPEFRQEKKDFLREEETFQRRLCAAIFIVVG